MSTENDQLGNRMKSYESEETMRFSSRELPLVIRLDGRGFSRFTVGMKKPFDEKLHELMHLTTVFLVKETSAVLGYHQSDEITLLILPPTNEQEIYFKGRFQKIISTLSAVGSVFFNHKLPEFFPEKVNMFPTFDCRAWNVRDVYEAANAVLWRELDAMKNSVQMAAQSMFSHKSLHGLNTKQLKEKMLLEKDFDWNKCSVAQQRGSVVQRVVTTSKLTSNNLEELPLEHNLRKNQELVVERSKVSLVELPPMHSIQNLSSVLFFGEVPMIRNHPVDND